jgi:putative oxidoreductase
VLRAQLKPRAKGVQSILGACDMNVLLWVLQLLLAAVYLAHGWLLLSPPASFIDQMNATMGPALRIFIGVVEVLAAAGLVLPGITRIATWLTPLAAAGLIPLMIGATVFHLSRGETSSAVTTAVLLALVTFVAYTRWRVAPIRSRAGARAA